MLEILMNYKKSHIYRYVKVGIAIMRVNSLFLTKILNFKTNYTDGTLGSFQLMALVINSYLSVALIFLSLGLSSCHETQPQFQTQKSSQKTAHKVNLGIDLSDSSLEMLDDEAIIAVYSSNLETGVALKFVKLIAEIEEDKENRNSLGVFPGLTQMAQRTVGSWVDSAATAALQRTLSRARNVFTKTLNKVEKNPVFKKVDHDIKVTVDDGYLQASFDMTQPNSPATVAKSTFKKTLTEDGPVSVDPKDFYDQNNFNIRIPLSRSQSQFAKGILGKQRIVSPLSSPLPQTAPASPHAVALYFDVMRPHPGSPRTFQLADDKPPAFLEMFAKFKEDEVLKIGTISYDSKGALEVNVYQLDRSKKILKKVEKIREDGRTVYE